MLRAKGLISLVNSGGSPWDLNFSVSRASRPRYWASPSVSTAEVVGALFGEKFPFNNVHDVTPTEGFRRESLEGRLMRMPWDASLHMSQGMSVDHPLVRETVASSSNLDICAVRAQATADDLPAKLGV